MDDELTDSEQGPDHRELPPLTLHERIEAVYGRIGRYIDRTFEQFQASVVQSPSPDDEAVLWAGVAAVCDDYHRKYLAGRPVDFQEERAIVAAVVAISTGEQDLRKLPVSFQTATALLSCYVDLADELPYSNP